MRNRIKPEHFDILGLITFPLIFVYAYFELNTKTTPEHPYVVLLLLTGVVGTLIDGTIVYKFLIKKRN